MFGCVLFFRMVTIRAYMNEGRKRVIGIIAGTLVARYLTTEDLFDSRRVRDRIIG